jgi:hypothetical protein
MGGIGNAWSSPRKASLCDLQKTVMQGEHLNVRVRGIFSDGFEMGVLTDTACPSERTWVEFYLDSTANKEQLRLEMNNGGKARVELEGEFYGPGLPDPKLPEVLKRSSQPGWGHLGAFRTKLVVHQIRKVESAKGPNRRVATFSWRQVYLGRVLLWTEK